MVYDMFVHREIYVVAFSILRFATKSSDIVGFSIYWGEALDSNKIARVKAIRTLNTKFYMIVG